MKTCLARSPRNAGFSLVELLVVILIIGLLGSLSYPYLQGALLRARSIKCVSNLRNIGIAVSQAASENNGQYPEIDQADSSNGPIYPPGSDAKNLADTLGPYGITAADLQCPIDLSTTPSYFKKTGSSYEWNPVFDDEVTVTPILYWSPTVKVPVNNSRVRLCTDFLPLHRGRMNALYGDGHVRFR